MSPLSSASAVALAAILGLSSPAITDGCVPLALAGDEELRALYQSGRSYEAFLGAATRRADLWESNTRDAEDIDPALVHRARAVGGSWHFLAVAIDACSDSVSTIPYLARLVSLVEGLEMRIVDSTAGRAVMEAHPTPDGRAATPTVLLLSNDFDEAGCFIERPPQLQTWILENSDWSGQQLYERKMEWYREDGGQATVEAFVEMLEAAGRGETVCR
ncbi:MAG: thioredoxin family protein [Longimicrobiales bacterium]|nr:thioredoxin family protein [Longimicrobiales bacterium]